MSLDLQDVIYEKHHRVRGVAWITINRPQALNAYTNDCAKEIGLAFEDATNDPEVGVIVLTGAGDRGFCTGGDVRGILDNTQGGQGIEGLIDPDVFVENCPKPVIARVNGYAIGGGHHLAYTCDLSIACEDHAKFGQVGPRVGSPASGRPVASLAYNIGMKRAKEFWYMTKVYDAHQAYEFGLINKHVPHERLDEEIDEWSADLMKKSGSCLRILKATFDTVYDPVKQPDRRWVEEIAPNFYASGEAAEGQQAFLEKRPPDFTKYPR